jgi:hypothetical protein
MLAVIFAPRGLAGALHRLPGWRERYLRAAAPAPAPAAAEPPSPSATVPQEAQP